MKTQNVQPNVNFRWLKLDPSVAEKHGEAFVKELTSSAEIIKLTEKANVKINAMKDTTFVNVKPSGLFKSWKDALIPHNDVSTNKIGDTIKGFIG